MKSIVITGHRDLSPDDIVRIRIAMRVLVAKEHIGRIYFGGARGTDIEALKSALGFRTENRPELVVVVPDTVDQQPSEAREWIRKADRVIELKNPITSDDNFSAYHRRNEYMVDEARKDSSESVTVAFWNGTRQTGTGACVAYARRREIQVEIITVSGVKK